MERAEMIRKMIAAGIDLETALDIALGGAAPEVQTTTESAENPEPETHSEPEAAATPEPEAKPAGISQEMGAQLLAAITKLTGAVQRSNIVSVGSDGDGESQQDKVDKMLTRLLSGEREGGSK